MMWQLLADHGQKQGTSGRTNRDSLTQRPITEADIGHGPKVREAPIGLRAPDVHNRRATNKGMRDDTALGHGFFESLFIDVAQNGTDSSTRNFSFAGV
jgi:hypothetical protein